MTINGNAEIVWVLINKKFKHYVSIHKTFEGAKKMKERFEAESQQSDIDYDITQETIFQE